MQGVRGEPPRLVRGDIEVMSIYVTCTARCSCGEDLPFEFEKRDRIACTCGKVYALDVDVRVHEAK